MTRNNRWLLIYLLVLWLIGWAVIPRRGNTDDAGTDLDTDVDTGNVAAAILHLVREWPQHPLHTDHSTLDQLATDIVVAGRRWGVDPYLLATLAYRESSFRPRARGKLGEFGLVQMHGPPLRRCRTAGVLLDTQQGQLYCGARYLAELVESCGSLRGGLTAYACGRCSVDEGTQVYQIVTGRLWLARSLRKKFENGN